MFDVICRRLTVVYFVCLFTRMVNAAESSRGFTGVAESDSIRFVYVRFGCETRARKARVGKGHRKDRDPVDREVEVRV